MRRAPTATDRASGVHSMSAMRSAPSIQLAVLAAELLGEAARRSKRPRSHLCCGEVTRVLVRKKSRSER